MTELSGPPQPMPYPMITSPLPVATLVQPASGSPTLAAARPLINTDELPLLIAAVWGGHFLPGRRCTVDLSPTLAAPRPLINTSPDPPAMVYPLQCGTPASPFLAAAGMFFLHQLFKSWLPSLDFIMLLGCVRRWRDFWLEFDHVIKFVWYVLKAFERMELVSYTDREAMRHVSR